MTVTQPLLQSTKDPVSSQLVTFWLFCPFPPGRGRVWGNSPIVNPLELYDLYYIHTKSLPEQTNVLVAEQRVSVWPGVQLTLWGGGGEKFWKKFAVKEHDEHFEKQKYLLPPEFIKTPGPHSHNIQAVLGRQLTLFDDTVTTMIKWYEWRLYFVCELYISRLRIKCYVKNASFDFLPTVWRCMQHPGLKK